MKTYICPKCGAIAEKNTYYGRITCTSCDWEDYDKNEVNSVNTTKQITLNLEPQDEHNGLKRKYIVFKSDTGESVENCFVLRPDIDDAAKVALEAYADATNNKSLSIDIKNWIKCEKADAPNKYSIINRDYIKTHIVNYPEAFTAEDMFSEFPYTDEKFILDILNDCVNADIVGVTIDGRYISRNALVDKDDDESSKNKVEILMESSRSFTIHTAAKTAKEFNSIIANIINSGNPFMAIDDEYTINVLDICEIRFIKMNE